MKNKDFTGSMEIHLRHQSSLNLWE